MDSKEYELDEYEQEIEDNLEFATIPEDAEEIKIKLKKMAKNH